MPISLYEEMFEGKTERSCSSCLFLEECMEKDREYYIERLMSMYSLEYVEEQIMFYTFDSDEPCDDYQQMPKDNSVYSLVYDNP